MTAQITKTKAEQGLLDQFENNIDALPGSAEIKSQRKQAMSLFEKEGLPDRRVEAWKYTDLRSAITETFPIIDETSSDIEITEQDLQKVLGTFKDLECHRLIFINGQYRCDAFGYGEGIDVKSLSEIFEETPEWIKHKLSGSTETAESDPIITLNSALLTDGVSINISSNNLEKPIHILYLNAGQSSRSVNIRNYIELQEGTQATIIEQYATLGECSFQTNSVTDVKIAKAAELTHHKIQNEGQGDNHLSVWQTQIEENASYKAFQLTTGAKLSRNQLYVTFSGEHASLNFGSTFLGRGEQHSDTTLVIDHAVPHCESRELYKGVMDDNATGVFQGKLMVKPIAQKTDGKQMAQALLLSETAEFDAKPELEIFADDVVCGHGATSGQIDEELLFYLKARGIPDQQARSLLVQAFIGEAFELIDDENIREKFSDIAAQWLAKGKG